MLRSAVEGDTAWAEWSHQHQDLIKHFVAQVNDIFKAEKSRQELLEKKMKRFTLFTFLYLALGVSLTAIALGYPNLPSGIQTSLFISAGLSYLVCLFSTFPFWREMTIRFYRRRNSAVILPWLVIGFNIVWMIWEVQSQNWTMEAILQAFSRLIVVLLFAEIIAITWQVNSEH